jgi:hypothetical protein
MKTPLQSFSINILYCSQKKIESHTQNKNPGSATVSPTMCSGDFNGFRQLPIAVDRVFEPPRPAVSVPCGLRLLVLTKSPSPIPHLRSSELCSPSWLEFYYQLYVFSAELFPLVHPKFSCRHSVREESFLLQLINLVKLIILVHPAYSRRYVSSSTHCPNLYPVVRGDLVYMGTNAPFNFKILKFLKFHTSMNLKNMALNI